MDGCFFFFLLSASLRRCSTIAEAAFRDLLTSRRTLSRVVLCVCVSSYQFHSSGNVCYVWQKVAIATQPASSSSRRPCVSMHSATWMQPGCQIENVTTTKKTVSKRIEKSHVTSFRKLVWKWTGKLQKIEEFVDDEGERSNVSEANGGDGYDDGSDCMIQSGGSIGTRIGT